MDPRLVITKPQNQQPSTGKRGNGGEKEAWEMSAGVRLGVAFKVQMEGELIPERRRVMSSLGRLKSGHQMMATH